MRKNLPQPWKFTDSASYLVLGTKILAPHLHASKNCNSGQTEISGEDSYFCYFSSITISLKTRLAWACFLSRKKAGGLQLAENSGNPLKPSCDKKIRQCDFCIKILLRILIEKMSGKGIKKKMPGISKHSPRWLFLIAHSMNEKSGSKQTNCFLCRK